MGKRQGRVRGREMGVFKKQGVYWIDYYVNGRRKRERIGPDRKLAATVLQKRKMKITEAKGELFR
jgi:hypothetical protein